MSYRTWHTYGIGICVDDIKTTPERVLKLASLDDSVLFDVQNYLNERFDGNYEDEELTIDDFCDFEGMFCDRGVTCILLEVMNSVEKIPFIYADSFDCFDYILYCPAYPWNLMENEIGLTREKLEEIFKKYISILTDDPVVIDWREVENGG